MAPSKCCHCFEIVGPLDTNRCDSCRLPLHLKCLELSKAEVGILSGKRSFNIKVMCNKCSSNIAIANDLKQIVLDLKLAMETRLSALENSLTATVVSPRQREEIIQESVDRSLRASNIIMANVPESDAKQEVDVVNDILEVIDPAAIAHPENVRRLGVKHGNQPRLLKVDLKSAELVKIVLRKRSMLKKTEYKNIMVHEDRTPAQNKYFKDLKQEIKLRQDRGELNLGIKYTNGIPSIVTRSELTANSNTNLSSNLN